MKARIRDSGFGIRDSKRSQSPQSRVPDPDQRQSAAWDVVGVGANSVDHVVVLPASVRELGASGKMRIRAQHVFCGGQTATAICACASLGLRTKYVGTVGSDEDGRLMREALERQGIDLSDLRVREGRSPSAVILVDDVLGERTVLWDRSDVLQLGPEEIPAEALTSARLVHVDDVDEAAAIRAAGIARSAGIPVTSDIERVTDRTEELIAAVTYPIFDERTPLQLTGEGKAEQALRKLRRRNSGLLCMTLGERGAMALEGDRVHHQPACQVEVKDTTGAGDVFRGGFIYALLQGWPVSEILRFANAAAAVSCTRVGAFNGVPTLQEVRQLIGA